MENTQDVQTAPEQTGSEESNIVEEVKVGESGQEQPAAEQVSVEATDAGKISEQAKSVVEEAKIEDTEQEQPVAEQLMSEK